ncbi:MAG: type IX secretion system membrane protein PorP/SprF [Bacteroidota bacterium]
MKTITQYIIALLLISLIKTGSVKAQQLPLHTQYRTNPFMVNPAIPIVPRIINDVRGEFDVLAYKHAVGASYRDQWWGLGPERPRTLSAFYQYYGSSPDRGIRNWDFWLGGYFLKDKIGATSNTGGYLTAAIHKDFGINQHLHVGISLGYLQYQFNAQDLYFGSDGNPNDPAIADNTLNLIDPGFGIYYSNEYVFVGFSMPKIVSNTAEGRRENIHHIYSVMGTTIKDWWMFSQVETSIWFRWVRYNNPHIDLGFKGQFDTSLPVWMGLYVDNTFAARADFGVIAPLSETIDFQLAVSYTNRVSFFNELGGVFEASNSLLIK